MYNKLITFNDFFGKERKQEVHFNLTTHEVFKLLVEFQAIFTWTEQMEAADPEGETDTAEVIEFYNHIETIILEAYGVPSADGLHFRKGGVYDFKESALFHSCMEMFVAKPSDAQALVDGLMPKNLQEIVKSADAGLAELAKSGTAPDALQAKIDALMAQRDAQQTTTPVVQGEVLVG